MKIVRFIISLSKVFLITFIFILTIDFFFGKKILEKYDSFFSKSQFYERLIRIDHPVYHHALKKNVKYSNNVSFNGVYELCTNNHGFKSKCNQQINKHYEFGFIGDSFTEGTPVEYQDTFVGLFEDHTNFKTANLGVVSYSPKIYLSKINYLLSKGYTFNHIVIFIDISDFYDDTNFYSIDKNLVVSEKYSKEKNLTRRKFLRNNFPLTNFYMFVIKKYKIKKNIYKESNNKEFPSFTDKVNLKAKWTYSRTNMIKGYDIGINEGHNLMVDHMIDLYKILNKKNIKMSLAVYPWPHQLRYDRVNSIHVNIWKNFCESRCENFIDYFPFFFNEVKKNSFLKTYKKYYFNNDPHFNNEGHRALADKLIEIFN